MPEHGTTISATQLANVLRFFTPALAKACERWEAKRLLASVENRGQYIERLLADVLTDLIQTSEGKPEAAARIPEVGEIFELVYNADEWEPMALLRFALGGKVPPSLWSFIGCDLRGIHRRRFKLVPAGGDLRQIQTVLDREGRTPEAQWIDAFFQAYPVTDGKGRIGIANAAWRFFTMDHYPILDCQEDRWVLRVWPDDGSVKGEHRWLVEVTP